MQLVMIILVSLSTALSATVKHACFKRSMACMPGSAEQAENCFIITNTRQPECVNIFQASHKPGDDSLADAKTKRKAHWAKWLGIGSLVGLLIPGVNLLSIPAAIAAIVISHQVPKESKYGKDAAIGRRTGWFTIGILVIIGFIVLLVTLPFGVR